MKVPEIEIYAQVPLTRGLIDRRLETSGQYFGKIGDVARQYGIKCSQVGTWLKFSAPKSRMQMFVEKLHFSVVPFTTSPPKNV